MHYLYFCFSFIYFYVFLNSWDEVSNNLCCWVKNSSMRSQGQSVKAQATLYYGFSNTKTQHQLCEMFSITMKNSKSYEFQLNELKCFADLCYMGCVKYKNITPRPWLLLFDLPVYLYRYIF